MIEFHEVNALSKDAPPLKVGESDRKFIMEEGGTLLGVAAMGLERGKIVLRGAELTEAVEENMRTAYTDLLWRSLLAAAANLSGLTVIAPKEFSFLLKHGFKPVNGALEAKTEEILFPHECAF